MKKRYEKPAMQWLTIVPETAIGADSDELLFLSLGWENEGKV